MTDKAQRRLEKTATGFARLASIVGKDRHPLFHMTSLENMKGVMASGKLMSSGEAAARSLVKDVEGGGSFGRTPLPSAAPRYHMNIAGDAASVPAEDLVYRRLDKPDALARASMPGTVGEYGRASLGSSHYNPSKNWDTISFAPEPDLAYGPVGLLTGSHKVRGTLRRTHPFSEVLAVGTPRFDKDGLIEAVDMPSATGVAVYDPRTTPRDVAKALKARGAIPINARLKRRLAAVNRGAGQVRATDIERGNVSYDAISKIPEYHRLVSLAERRLGMAKLADKNNPGRITKMLKAAKPSTDGFAPLAYVKGSAKKSYVVGIQDGKSWRCTCPDWTYRGSKSGAPCKHIRVVQERREKRGNRGHTKTAATRYDKEVARGNISYADIAKRMPGLTTRYAALHPGGADYAGVRRALEAPSTAPNLDRLRRIRELSVRPTARAAAMRDGIVFDLTHGPAAVAEGAYARPILGEDGALTGKHKVHVPVTGSGSTRGTLDHEIAETREQRRAGIRPMATHEGTGPLVAERAAIVGDPAAFGDVSKMRSGRGADPDDNLIWRKMKQMGATPDRPMPMGGKAHRSLDRWVDRNADMLSSESRGRALLLARDFGEGVDPRDVSPYLPKRVRELIASHDSDPDSAWFDDPSHPKYPEAREIENWGTAKPRRQPMSMTLALNGKAPSKEQLADAMVNRSTASGSKLRTLLRALRAGVL